MDLLVDCELIFAHQLFYYDGLKKQCGTHYFNSFLAILPHFRSRIEFRCENHWHNRTKLHIPGHGELQDFGLVLETNLEQDLDFYLRLRFEILEIILCGRHFVVVVVVTIDNRFEFGFFIVFLFFPSFF